MWTSRMLHTLFANNKFVCGLTSRSPTANRSLSFVRLIDRAQADMDHHFCLSMGLQTLPDLAAKPKQTEGQRQEKGKGSHPIAAATGLTNKLRSHLFSVADKDKIAQLRSRDV